MSRDSAQAVAVGIAAASAVLVAGGLLLSAVGALDGTGWAVVVLLALVVAVFAFMRDPARVVPTALALAAVGITVGAVALSRASAVEHERETRFTQLWMVERPSRGTAELGVRNSEHERVTYRLQVYSPRSRPRPPFLVNRTIVLDQGESWSSEVRLPVTGDPERVNAELFRLGDLESYRSAHVWTRPRP